MIQTEGLHWFALRITYCRELKVQKALEDKGIRTFVPMRSFREEKGGKVVRKTVPAINNLVFAYSDQQTLYAFMQSEGDASMTRFIWDRVTRMPIIIPDKQMDDFIRVCEASADEAVFLSELNDQLRTGTRVRVVFGPLAGVEGRVVRIRKSRRILVEIPGVMAVAGTYVPVEYLELLSEE